MITSDDVFDFMLNLRSLNDGIDRRREELFEDYLDAKYAHFQMRSLKDYEALKKVNMARSHTQSRFVRENLMGKYQGVLQRRKRFYLFLRKYSGKLSLHAG